MSLLSSIANIFTGRQEKKAIQAASSAEIAQADRALAEGRRQYDLSRADMLGQLGQSRADALPFLEAGQWAVGEQGNLLGRGGADAQAQAIAALQQSPMYQALFNTGQEAVLANASATGGVRGGNVQGALAGFARDTLAQTLQQKLAALGGLTGQGANTGSNLGQLGGSTMANLGQLGQTNAANSAALFLNRGQSQASGILGKQTVNKGIQNGFADLGAQLSRLFMGGF